MSSLDSQNSTSRIDEIEKLIQNRESKIASYQAELEGIESQLSQLIDANASLHQSAQEARAELSGWGKGLGSVLFGKKYAAERRKSASSVRAQVSKKVADKKADLLKKKQKLNENKRNLKAQISEEKAGIRELKVEIKILKTRSNNKTTKVAGKKTSISEEILNLSNLYEKGLITEEEFAAAKQKILNE